MTDAATAVANAQRIVSRKRIGYCSAIGVSSAIGKGSGNVYFRGTGSTIGLRALRPNGL